jgi:hypothetical protein
VVKADLLDEGEMVRHDPDRLARAVMSCVAKTTPELVSAN